MDQLHEGEPDPVGALHSVKFIGMIRSDNISEIDSAVAL